MIRKHSLTALVAVTIGLAVSQASAADLPRKAPVYAPPPPPPYVWTGCYVGANVGGAWAHLEATEVATGIEASHTNSGVAGGGQIGCDYQMGVWVVGIRNMFDGTSISRSVTVADPGGTLFPSLSGTFDGRVRWFDALTARGGYLVQPNVLFYVQGGAAWAKTELTATDASGLVVGSLSDNSRTGWTVGGGVEWMFVPHWSVFVEYNFLGFGTRSSSFVGCAGTCVLSGKADIQNVLVGLNYKF